MFNSEFFPTPKHVLDMMEIDCYGKICADFSAGKGDIVDYLKDNGAERVIGCEINKDLQKILEHKCEMIGEDFFQITSSEVSHVQYIVINPPFSNANKHILHAWNIAPEGCEITALCNWQTLSNDYSTSRTELKKVVENYGSKRNLGDCFSIAERKTNVEIGLVKLFKPAISNDFDFDGFFFTYETEKADNAIIEYNEIRAVVNSYVAAVKCFDKCQEAMKEMNACTSHFGYAADLSFKISYNENVTTKEAFAREMQIKCWKFIFNKINIEKYVTKGVLEDINKFINSRLNYPFTMNNVYRMIEIIIGTRGQIMNRAIVEAIDNFTKHTHENRHSVEGWKTNVGHLLNKKFIVGYIAGNEWSKLGIKDYNCFNYTYIIDLVKALCYITGIDFYTIPEMKAAPCEGVFKDKDGKEIIDSHERYKAVGYNNFESNTWYDWAFFEFKVFKKGTGHFKFKDEKVWELLNRTYAEIKGQVLPEKI